MPTESPSQELGWIRARLPAPNPDSAVALWKSGSELKRAKTFRALHLNESPHPPSPRAIGAMAEAARSANRYPDRSAAPLRLDLAERSGVAAERIVCGHGSEELIHAICALGVGPGAEVVVPAPTFPAFAQLAALYGGKVVRVPLTADGVNDSRGLTSAVGPATRILFACTPNPPSGGMMDESQVEELVDRSPPDLLLVIDEAYHEYGALAGGPDVLSILSRRNGPWVNLRTFSKAYSLAGARVGYAYCSSAELANAIGRAKPVYGPGSLALAGALESLKDQEHLGWTLNAIADERSRLSCGLLDLGLSPYPSAANFVSVTLPMPAARAVLALYREGILVRDWRDPDHQHEIRVTVGLPEDTAAVLQAVKNLLADASAA